LDVSAQLDAGTQPAPEGSLLALTEAYMRAISALHDARNAVEVAADDAAIHLHALQRALEVLGSHIAADTGRHLTLQHDAAGLARVEVMLRAELALIQCILVVPPQAQLLRDMEVFGVEVAAALPSAAYDIEEAAQCLALRRTTAAVYHCMKVVEHGIAELARRAGIADPIASGERGWQAIMRRFRAADASVVDEAVRALDNVRRVWRGAMLITEPKYTETEAARIFRNVGDFLKILAASG